MFLKLKFRIFFFKKMLSDFAFKGFIPKNFIENGLSPFMHTNGDTPSLLKLEKHRYMTSLRKSLGKKEIHYEPKYL